MSSIHFEYLNVESHNNESADSIDKMIQSACEKLKLKSLNWKGCMTYHEAQTVFIDHVR